MDNELCQVCVNNIKDTCRDPFLPCKVHEKSNQELLNKILKDNPNGVWFWSNLPDKIVYGGTIGAISGPSLKTTADLDRIYSDGFWNNGFESLHKILKIANYGSKWPIREGQVGVGITDDFGGLRG